MGRLLASMGTAMLLASVVVLLTAIGSIRSAAAAERPNILFVMTDDQPIQDTMAAMPEVRGRVRDMGVTLPNAYTSESVCCPARASILRGQYPHNTHVLRNGPPEGGVQTFRARGEEDNTVAHWLGREGYSTALVGKYMNGYDASYKPPGWSYWYAKGEPKAGGKEGQRQRPRGRLGWRGRQLGGSLQGKRDGLPGPQDRPGGREAVRAVLLDGSAPSAGERLRRSL